MTLARGLTQIFGASDEGDVGNAFNIVFPEGTRMVALAGDWCRLVNSLRDYFMCSYDDYLPLHLLVEPQFHNLQLSEF